MYTRAFDSEEHVAAAIARLSRRLHSSTAATVAHGTADDATSEHERDARRRERRLHDVEAAARDAARVHVEAQQRCAAFERANAAQRDEFWANYFAAHRDIERRYAAQGVFVDPHALHLAPSAVAQRNALAADAISSSRSLQLAAESDASARLTTVPFRLSLSRASSSPLGPRNGSKDLLEAKAANAPASTPEVDPLPSDAAPLRSPDSTCDERGLLPGNVVRGVGEAFGAPRCWRTNPELVQRAPSPGRPPRFLIDRGTPDDARRFTAIAKSDLAGPLDVLRIASPTTEVFTSAVRVADPLAVHSSDVTKRPTRKNRRSVTLPFADATNQNTQ